MKGEANKWLVAGASPDNAMIVIGNRWLDGQSLDFCSEDCLHRYVSRFVADMRNREASQEARES